MDRDLLSAAFRDAEPGRLMGRGHPIGDFLEAPEWRLLQREEGRLRVSAHLPDQVKNPRGQLFGGFTGTYVDFMALHTFWAGRTPSPGRPWLATVNMRIDYFAPVLGPRFEMLGTVVHRRGGMTWVEIRFFGSDEPSGESTAVPTPDPEGALLVWAYLTLREVYPEPAADRRGPEGERQAM